MSLPQSLHQFIGRHIDSIETLEVLLLLHRTPSTGWTAEAIEAHLGMNEGSARRRLQRLAENGLAAQGSSGAYRYSPAQEEDRDVVADLAKEYANRRISVVNTVFSENLARLRAFSDAFKVKNE